MFSVCFSPKHTNSGLSVCAFTCSYHCLSIFSNSIVLDSWPLLSLVLLYFHLTITSLDAVTDVVPLLELTLVSLVPSIQVFAEVMLRSVVVIPIPVLGVSPSPTPATILDVPAMRYPCLQLISPYHYLYRTIFVQLNSSTTTGDEYFVR